MVLSEAHNLTEADAVLRFRRRIADLDDWLADLDKAIGSARERGVHEPYWIAGAYVRSQIAAERDWLATTIERIESKDLPWQPRKNA